MSRFTPDAAAALPGPDWLRQRRVAAAERFSVTALPTAAEEIWRYSRIGQIDLDRYGPDPRPAGPLDEAASFDEAALAVVPVERSALVVTVNGRITTAEVDPRVALGADQQRLGRVMAEPIDAFALLNDAFVGEPVVLTVPPGLGLEHPLVVVHRLDGDGSASFPRLVVQAGRDSRVEVVEIVLSADVDAFSAPVTELRAERDARLGYLGLQDLGPRVWQVATQVVEVDAQATVTSATAAFGGDYARLRTDCRLVGRGASGNLLSLYFGSGRQMLDFRTFQDHQAPDTTSDLLYKGAVDDQSHSVYSGLIRVRPAARGTNAFQTNRNLKLSSGAWAESVPNLEIENNDVRCSHASTVGPIDLEQRFYLESRGVPPDAAERLIVSGFFDDLVARLPIPALHDAIRQRVAAKLGQAQLGGSALAGAAAAGPPAARPTEVAR